MSALGRIQVDHVHAAAIAGVMLERKYRIPRRDPLCACGRSATRRNTAGTDLCETCSKYINLGGFE